jgi:hypothetical protein
VLVVNDLEIDATEAADPVIREFNRLSSLVKAHAADAVKSVETSSGDAAENTSDPASIELFPNGIPRRSTGPEIDPTRPLSEQLPNTAWLNPATKTTGLTPEQVFQGFEKWVKELKLDPETFLRAAQADGHPIDTAAAMKQAVEWSRLGQAWKPDSAPSQQPDIDAGPKPNEYRINFRDRIPEWSKDVFELNSELQGALSAMRFPPEIGAGVIENALDDSKVFMRQDAVSRELYNRGEGIALSKAVGPEKVANVISNARIMASLIQDKNPELFDKLINNGVFSSARTVAQLNMQYERLMAR